MEYIVEKIPSGTSDKTIRKIQELLDNKSKYGWELHSLITQSWAPDGNIAIFSRHEDN